MCLFALGTDTGGSIRHPASFCGVVGFKPTYGSCSRFGLISMTSSTDVPGPLAKTAEDALLVWNVMKGEDKHDSTTVKLKEENFKIKNKSLAGIKVGVAEEYFGEGLDKQAKTLVLSAIDELKKLGAEIVPIDLPNTRYGVSVYYIITPSEISSNLARFDGLRFGLKGENDDLTESYLASRGQGFGAEVKRRIMLGTYALSSGYYDAYYLKAQAVRAEIIKEFHEAFKQVDLIAAPATPSTAFRLGEQNQDPLKMYLEDIFLTPSSLAGLPAVSLPAGAIGNLPLGWQLIGPQASDELVLKVASTYESATDQPKLEIKA
jgi:aspartyl-tRNA(Asn)/glutamyl-tRNA(Gln) amidotransferase subunit A